MTVRPRRLSAQELLALIELVRRRRFSALNGSLTVAGRL
jgi:hypothetical protein